MFIHLDPRRPDVLVPRGFMGQPQLVLQVGLNMAIAIPDLKIDEAGISCTLSFNRSPFWCRIPWSAIYALVGEDGRGGVWAEDVPAEIQQHKGSAAPKGAAAKKARPKLSAVGAADRARTREEAKGEASRDDGIVEAEPKRAALSAVPRQEPAEASRGAGRDAGAEPSASTGELSEEAGGQAAGTSQPPGGKKPKREIPPYLRVIK